MRQVELDTADGVMAARVFEPPAGGPAPAVVMFTDIGGLRPSYDAKARRLSEHGYAVLMPNIYYRREPGPVVPEGRSFRDPEILARLRGYAGDLTPAAQRRDFAALVAFLDGDRAFAASAGIGVVGYCLTGGFALRMAAAHPDRVLAAAGFHSAQLAPEDGTESPAAIVGGIRGRVYLGHADHDPHLPPDQIGRMDRALAAAGVHFTTELFRGAEHGWTTGDASSHHPVLDALHYRRLCWFLDEAMDRSDAD